MSYTARKYSEQEVDVISKYDGARKLSAEELEQLKEGTASFKSASKANDILDEFKKYMRQSLGREELYQTFVDRPQMQRLFEVLTQNLNIMQDNMKKSAAVLNVLQECLIEKGIITVEDIRTTAGRLIAEDEQRKAEEEQRKKDEADAKESSEVRPIENSTDSGVAEGSEEKP